MSNQTNLFPGTVMEPDYTKGMPLLERFKLFHETNPHVYTELERRAWALVGAGVGRIGIAMMFESMRYDYAIQTQGDPYKLNNSFRAFYARLLRDEGPELRSLIEVRFQPSQDTPDQTPEWWSE